MIKLTDILRESQELSYEKGKEAIIKKLQSDLGGEYAESKRGKMTASVLKAVESKTAEEAYKYIDDSSTNFRNPNKHYFATLYKVFMKAAREL
jgi:hypothetical protein